jgi:Tol biopolymer transport system component
MQLSLARLWRHGRFLLLFGILVGFFVTLPVTSGQTLQPRLFLPLVVQRLQYLSYTGTSPGVITGIFRASQFGTEITQLTTAADFDSTWAPDGQQFAVVSEGAIVQVNAQGQRQTIYTCAQSCTSLAWSPDGQTLLFEMRPSAGAPQQVFRIQIDGNGLQQLSNGFLGNIDPSWSPDGTRIAFIAEANTPDPKITIIDTAGAILKESPVRVGSTHPSWSPDGTQLVYAELRRLSIINTDGSNDHIIPGSEGLYSIRAPVWWPGSAILYTEGGAILEPPTTVKMVSPTGNDVRVIDRGTDPTWIPFR